MSKSESHECLDLHITTATVMDMIKNPCISSSGVRVLRESTKNSNVRHTDQLFWLCGEGRIGRKNPIQKIEGVDSTVMEM